MNTFVIIVGIIIVIVGIGIFLIYRNLKDFARPDLDFVVDFLEQKKENYALHIERNQQPILSHQSDVPFPLASTVKIVIAIEFAYQFAEGRIQDESVTLEQLDAFYIPKTDGDAHKEWLKYITDHGIVQDHNVSLLDVAKGMIRFSSNANTEFLLQQLGYENVNKRIAKLELDGHEPVYPFVSAVLIPNYLKNQNLNNKNILAKLKEMPKERYISLSYDVSLALKRGTLNKTPILLNEAIQKIWSQHLPAATAYDYIKIVRRLNNRQFPANVQQLLIDIMEGIMENPQNQQWLQHAGQKGGSTPFVITNAAYATDNKGNQTEFVFLSNNLTLREKIKLSYNMNDFILNILKDPTFLIKSDS